MFIKLLKVKPKNKKIEDLQGVNELFEEFISRLDKTRFSLETIRNAYDFAKKAHAFQKRKSGEPYILHPLEVAEIVYELGLDEESIISAFLHDTVEDTQVTLQDIGEEFGETVELIVDGLTKIQHYGEKKFDKNAEALKKILLASAKDIRILLIKLADRLHNMRTLGEMPVHKQQRIARETLAIYAPIAQKVGIYSLKWELEDLSLKYINPEMFQYIKKKVGLKRKEREETVKKVVEEIQSVLNLYSYHDVLVLGRPKNFFSIYKKIKDKAKDFDEIFDLYAVRIITKDLGDCYSILGNLHENFQSFPNKLKDYIANPKNNGYQSIHTVIFSREIKSPVEIQIRTDDMNKLAEFGVAAHWKYKNLKEDKKFEKKISWLREVMQWEKEHRDDTSEFLQLLKFDFFEDEIFVFTPKNDLITLPEGASVLDFAYAVHSEIGDRAYKAKVNGMVCSIDKTLKSGDIVEIVTQKSAKPNDKWLKFVKTSKARLKIKSALNLKFQSSPKQKISQELSFEDMKDQILRLDEFKKVRKAGCCTIDYGDQIIGVVPKKGEIVIHKASCENAKYSLHKKLPLNWKSLTQKEVQLEIYLRDRYGLLIDVLNVFSHFNVNVSQLNTKVQKDGSVKMTVELIDGEYITKLVKKLEELESVVYVKVIRSLLDKFKVHYTL